MYGLAIATCVGAVKTVPTIYWSLEIRFLSEFTDYFPILVKRFERLCHRHAAFTIIQDAERAESLVAENGVRNPQIVIVPNAPAGFPQIQSSNLLQRRLGLPMERRIILHIGMISPAVLSLEIATEATKWSDEFALVFHERAKRTSADSYLTQVQQAGGGRVLLSLDPVPYDELDALVMSGHIGLVFYRKDLGPNFSQVSGASGKLAHYLRCGLPVICIDFPGLMKVVDRYQCGICVGTPAEIESAVKTILGNYGFYRKNALQGYKEYYEFDSHFDQVVHRMRNSGNLKSGTGAWRAV
jgi:glycosyltransferase involved in cell wall biosynthesis